MAALPPQKTPPPLFAQILAVPVVLWVLGLITYVTVRIAG